METLPTFFTKQRGEEEKRVQRDEWKLKYFRHRILLHFDTAQTPNGVGGGVRKG